MNDYVDGIIALAKRATTVRITSSGTLSTKPCLILSVIVEPDNASNKSQAKLINGETSSQEILVVLKAQYSHPTHNGPFPMYFNRGLYIDLTDNVDSCTVQFLLD